MSCNLQALGQRLCALLVAASVVGAQQASAQPLLDKPLRPWLAPARSPLAMQPPTLPPTAQLARLAQRDAQWAERWGVTAPSIVWTEATLDLVIKYRQNPLRAARALVYVNTVLHDALADCLRQRCSPAAERAAMHVAAGLVLEHLYPEETAGRWQAMSASAVIATAAVSRDAGDLALGWRTGLDTAEAAIQRALFDGSDADWNIMDRPAPGPHVWRAAPPMLQHNPVEPTAPGWRTWVLKDSREIVWPSPPAFGSAHFNDEIQELIEISRSLSTEQKRQANEWNLDLGTVTPGGVWNKRAIQLAREQGLNVRQTARLMAALNVAIFDAFVACWQAKLQFWTPRPITVIRDSIDPSFTPYLVTPGFPAYPSGHSTISGAASEVLAAFIPASAADQRRAAEEAAMSRLFGGIHVRSDNSLGLQVGRSIGERVVERQQ